MPAALTLRNWLFKRFTLLAALVLVSACVPSGAHAEVLLNGRELTIRGFITDQVADQIEALSGQGFDTVTVNVVGGERTAAIRVANLIHAANARLIVDQYCLSACAQYLAPAASEVVLLPVSMILFHYWPHSYREAIDLPNFSSQPVTAYQLNEAIEELDELYTAWGIRPELILCTDWLLGERSFSVTFGQFGQRLPAQTLTMTSTFQGVWPSLTILRDAGINVVFTEDFPPKANSDVMLRHLRRRGTTVRVWREASECPFWTGAQPANPIGQASGAEQARGLGRTHAAE